MSNPQFFTGEMMFSAGSVRSASSSRRALFQEEMDSAIDGLVHSLPDPRQISCSQRRGIIARYSAVLEGNFIYWMTAAYLSARSEEARSIIRANLSEEIRDCHPGMLRKFALAAGALPTDSDAMAVYPDLTNVRHFVGRLAGLQIVLMMAFFEGFIQRFMAFLAELARLQGSAEMQYTDVHGICDIAHTQELLRAMNAEITISPPDSRSNLFEGVNLLRTLILRIVQPAPPDAAGASE
jgi:hypothetical protein